MDHVSFIHSCADGHLGHFCPLAIVTGAALSVCVRICVLAPVFNSLGNIPGSGSAYGDPVLHFLRS